MVWAGWEVVTPFTSGTGVAHHTGSGGAGTEVASRYLRCVPVVYPCGVPRASPREGRGYAPESVCQLRLPMQFPKACLRYWGSLYISLG